MSNTADLSRHVLRGSGNVVPFWANQALKICWLPYETAYNMLKLELMLVNRLHNEFWKSTAVIYLTEANSAFHPTVLRSCCLEVTLKHNWWNFVTVIYLKCSRVWACCYLEHWLCLLRITRRECDSSDIKWEHLEEPVWPYWTVILKIWNGDLHLKYILLSEQIWGVSKIRFCWNFLSICHLSYSKYRTVKLSMQLLQFCT